MSSWLWIVACRLAPRIDVSQRQQHRAPLDRLSIRNLQVGQATADLIVQRYSGTVGLNVERPIGNVEVLLLH